MESPLLSAHNWVPFPRMERDSVTPLKQFSFLQYVFKQPSKFPSRPLAFCTAVRNKWEELITTPIYFWWKIFFFLFSLWEVYYNVGIVPQSKVLDFPLAEPYSWRLPTGKKKTQVIHYCCSSGTAFCHWCMPGRL